MGRWNSITARCNYYHRNYRPQHSGYVPHSFGPGPIAIHGSWVGGINFYYGLHTHLHQKKVKQNNNNRKIDAEGIRRSIRDSLGEPHTHTHTNNRKEGAYHLMGPSDGGDGFLGETPAQLVACSLTLMLVAHQAGQVCRPTRKRYYCKSC